MSMNEKTHIEAKVGTLLPIGSTPWVIGLDGEIVRFDTIKRFWKYNRNGDKWEVWADAQPNGTLLYEGTKEMVDEFLSNLAVVLKPVCLSTDKGLAELSSNLYIDDEIDEG